MGFVTAYMGIYGGGTGSIAPTIPGIELRVPAERVQYRVPDERLHYRVEEETHAT